MILPRHQKFLATFFNAFAWFILRPESLSCGVCDEEFQHIHPAEQHFKDEHPDHISHFEVNQEQTMTDNGDPDITVEEGVEPSEDAIDVEQLSEMEGVDGATEEILRQLGATEDEIDELMDGDEPSSDKSSNQN